METVIEDLVGTSFLRKKGHNDRDRESFFNTEECGIDEIKQAGFLGLLFSANWCPPCKTFLKILKDFYNECNIGKKKFEVLYIPTDPSEEDFRDHYAHMPWLALPYKDPRIAKLTAKYKVTGIPVLVIVDSQSGFLVTMKGRKDIHEHE